jgi:alpha-tubulin suppressor-like RCC1 family protein
LRTIILSLFLIFSFVQSAYADCTTVTIGNQPAGYLFYNVDQKIFQYCNGTDWISMNSIPGSGGGGCGTTTMGLQPEGRMFYNGDNRVLQGCAGNVWQPFGPIGGSNHNVWSQIATGEYTTCGIKTNGTLWCWGSDAAGALGNGATTGNQSAPSQEATGSTNWTQVNVGTNHNCAVKTDGTLWCWGSDWQGKLGNGATVGDQVTPVQEVTAATDWAQVAAEGNHSCAIKTDNTLWCWGQETEGQLGNGATASNQDTPVQEVTAATDWAQVDLGGAHSCAIKTGGTLWCWGQDTQGHLGNGAATGNQDTPVQEVTAATDWAQVGIGIHHSCAVKTGGTLWCWGRGFEGQIGDGLGAETDSPSQEATLSTDWKQVNADHYHSCAVKTNGTAWCWGGDGSSGKLGDGPELLQKNAPVQEATGATDWTQIDAGFTHSCALTTNGTYSCWGDDTYGQLGNGSSTGAQLSPTQELTSATDWAQVSVSPGHSCAIKTNGTAWCWGSDYNGALGNGPTLTDNQFSPTQEATLATSWAQISVKNELGGTRHSCAVRTDGTLWCWGTDGNGQLGNGATTGDQDTPVQEVTAATDWAQVSKTFAHTCAVKTDGTLWCWGADTNGQLGNGATTGNQDTPVQEVTAATDWAQVSTGPYYSCAVKTDGTLWCWGIDTNNQLGNGAPTGDQDTPVQEVTAATNWAQVEGGRTHTCAIKTDDTLWCWGWDGYAALGNGADGNQDSPDQEATAATNWEQVAIGQYHSCAVKTDGTLWCWGRNNAGQLGNGTSTTADTPVQEVTAATNWAQVAAGSGSACAVKTDGTLWCWGADTYGKLGTSLYSNASPFPYLLCENPTRKEGQIFYNSSENVMQYCDGGGWVPIGKGFGTGNMPLYCTNIGDMCSDGTVYAGLSPDGNVPMYTLPCDYGQSWDGSSCTGARSNQPWNNGNFGNKTLTNVDDGNDGDGNTLALLSIDSDSGAGGTQPHLAAQTCSNLSANGHSDWYLPALNEVNVLYTNKVAIGGFDVTGTTYWSSTEGSQTGANAKNFDTGGWGWWDKDQNKPVRCVRK